MIHFQDLSVISALGHLIKEQTNFSLVINLVNKDDFFNEGQHAMFLYLDKKNSNNNNNLKKINPPPKKQQQKTRK